MMYNTGNAMTHFPVSLRAGYGLFRGLAPALFLFLTFALAPAASGEVSGEAKRISERAEQSKKWSVSLQERVDKLRTLKLATLFLGALTTLLAAGKAVVGDTLPGPTQNKDDVQAEKPKSGKGSISLVRLVAITTAVAAGTATFLAAWRSEILHAEKDSAAEILAGLGEYRDSVQNKFDTYSDLQQERDKHRDQPNAAEVGGQDLKKLQDDWRKQDDQWDKEIAEKVKEMGILQDSGQKLIHRARLLLETDQPRLPASVALWPFGNVYAQRQPSYQGPSWQQSATKNSDSEYYQDVTGEGNCTQSFAAREYSRYEGRIKIALQIEPGASGSRIIQILKALDTSVQDRDQYTVQESGSMIRAVTWTRIFKETAKEKVAKMPPLKPNPPQRWEGNAAISPSGTTIVKGLVKRGGTFEFTFDSKGGILRVRDVAVFQDGSAGSTRWAFDVLVDDKLLFRIPTHRYDDSGKPTRCQSTQQFEASLPTGAKLIKMYGYYGDEL